jgi:hypothetical protein
MKKLGCLVNIFHFRFVMLIIIYPMMRFFNRILNLFRGRKTPKPVPAGPVKKEEYERWLGI